MDAKKIVVGTIVGGIVLFGVGYAIFEVLLGDFFASQMTETARGAMRDPPLYWSVGVGCLAWAALISYAMGARGASGTAAGALTGVIVGFLTWLSADFFSYGFQSFTNLTQTLVDPLASAVLSGIAGAVIGIVLSKMKSA